MQTNAINLYKLPLITTNCQSFNASNMISEESTNMQNKQTNEQEQKRNRKEIYGKGNEAKVIRDEIGDFNINESIAYKTIIKYFGRSVRLSEVLGILNSIQIYLQIKTKTTLPLISRNEKRSFQLLMKYIERNSELIFPFFQYISLCDSSFQIIPLDTK